MIILNWWSKRGRNGVFPSFFVKRCIRLILKSMFQSFPSWGKAIIGLLNCEVSFLPQKDQIANRISQREFFLPSISKMVINCNFFMIRFQFQITIFR